MAYKDMVGVVQLIRELNEALNDPKKLDEALFKMQEAMEKGATAMPDKPGNA